MADRIDHAKAKEKLSWWVRTLTNMYHKLYQNHFGDFCRDHRDLINHLYHFRSNCRGRGWDIPEREQERLIGKLVSRCQEAILKEAVERKYIPGYFGKSLSRFVGEIADEAQRRWKVNASAKLPQEMVLEAIQVAMARIVIEKVEEI